jgi:iron complex outermembrane receptor protein
MQNPVGLRLKGASSARLLALPIALMAIDWSATAHADQSATASGIEEIVVTARRKDEALQDVPIDITALSGEALAARGVTSPSDLMMSVPGVFSAPGSIRGSNAPVFAIRGQVNRDPTPTNDPSIGLYFAEVPWARVEGSNAAFLDLQSVQVLKGPQGTLFGRNTTAGAILITPNAPTDRFEGYAKAGGGDYGYFTAEGAVNAPLGDKVAVRLAASHEQRTGYLQALPSGQKLDDLNNYSLRASVKLTPADNLTSTLIGTFYHSGTNGDGEKIISVAPASPSPGVAGLYQRFVAALAQSSALGKYQAFNAYAPSIYNTLSSGVPSMPAAAEYAHVQTWSIQDNSGWNVGSSGFLGEVTLKNIVSYRSEADDLAYEVAGVPFLSSATSTAPFGGQHMNQVTEELQAQGKRGALDYIVGAFYFRESGHDSNFTYTAVPIASVVDNRIVNTSYSAFAHANYDLSAVVIDGVSISGGIRLNDDERYWDGRNRRQTTPGISATPLYTCTYQPTLPVNDGSLCRFPESATFRVPTWDVGLNYKLAASSLVYGSVSKGYRSGGFNESAGSAAGTAPFLPEKVVNFELGTKNDFTIGDTAARLNVAAFYTDYKDIQRTLNLALPNGVLTNLTVNAAKAHIEGVETELTVKPTHRLETTLAYSYILPKYDKFADLYQETRLCSATVTTGCVPQVTNFPVDVSDSQFILVSRHSLSATVSYMLPVDDHVGAPIVRASYYYRSSFFTVNDINTAHCNVPGDPNPAAVYVNCYFHNGQLPGYGLLNMRLDWANVFGHNVDLSVFVNNVANKYYYNNALNVLGSFGESSAQIGPPRMFGVTVNVPFGGR